MKVALVCLLVSVQLAVADGLRIRVSERSRPRVGCSSQQLSSSASFQFSRGGWDRSQVFYFQLPQPQVFYVGPPQLTLPPGQFGGPQQYGGYPVSNGCSGVFPAFQNFNGYGGQFAPQQFGGYSGGGGY
jgi:hypothetical protein